MTKKHLKQNKVFYNKHILDLLSMDFIGIDHYKEKKEYLKTVDLLMRITF